METSPRLVTFTIDLLGPRLVAWNALIQPKPRPNLDEIYMRMESSQFHA
jgi:hypothetical protein